MWSKLHTTVWALCCLSIMALVQLVSANSLPLCSVVTAIASDTYRFSLPTDNIQFDTAAIVIAGFAGLGDTHQPLNINATYIVPPGAAVTLVGTNAISIPYAMPSTEIQVQVSGGAGVTTPFSMVAYHANLPSCFIPISSFYTFRGILPSAFKTNDRSLAPAFAYFATEVPSGFNAITITISGNPAPAASIFVLPQGDPSSESSEHLLYKSGDVIPASGTFRFAYVPGVVEPPASVDLFDVEISLKFSFTTATAAPQPRPPKPTSAPGGIARSGGWLWTLFKMGFVIFMLWFLSTGYYNYTNQGIHQFPLMFPFGEQLAVWLAVCVSGLQSRPSDVATLSQLKDNFSSLQTTRRLSENYQRFQHAEYVSMNRLLKLSCRKPHVPSFSTGGLRFQQRFITRLYTSYFAGQLFPTQLVVPKQRLPQGVFRHPGSASDEKGEINSNSGMPSEELTWDSPSTDIMQVHGSSSGAAKKQEPARRYFPLAEAAKIELQGDYLSEGGFHQEALEHYGVVAKAYELAYPENHLQRVGILIKLGGALRRTGRHKSSKEVIQRALSMAENAAAPQIEIIVEGLLELGLTQEALKEETAGDTFEEGVRVVQEFHNFGASHKMLRLLPKLSRRFNLNYEQKFLYYSPFDWDRTYALADQCLQRAGEFYRKKNDREGVIRVLQTRVELIGKKFFNMRDFAGRIHTMRGHWMRRARHLTDAPTPDELLRYSPTVHQVYHDFRFELNAPIGREDEVAPGTNRVVLDMGNPYRRRGKASREMMRDADYNYQQYVRKKEFGEKSLDNKSIKQVSYTVSLFVVLFFLFFLL
eukprot:gene5999-4304_t